jgi:hypothetical protein
MAEYLKLSRLYLLLLAICVVGRFYLGNVRHVPYERATDKLSIVIMTLFASLFYAAFCRRWLGFGLLRALALAALLGLMAEVAIFVSTLLSYAFGIHSYFNYPLALQALPSDPPLPVGEALIRRAQGLIAGPVSNAVMGAIGWVMGGLLPERR